MIGFPCINADLFPLAIMVIDTRAQVGNVNQLFLLTFVLLSKTSSRYRRPAKRACSIIPLVMVNGMNATPGSRH